MDKFAWIEAFVTQMRRRGAQTEAWRLVDRAEELYDSWSDYHPALVAMVERQFSFAGDAMPAFLKK